MFLHTPNRFTLAMLACLALLNDGVSALPEPQLKWSAEVTATGDSCPIAYPSKDPDSILIGVPGRLARVGTDGKVLYDVVIPGAPDGSSSDSYHFHSLPVDLDGDGIEEVLGGAYKSVFALNGADGSVIWSFDLGTTLDMFHMAAAADLDGDGKQEILQPNMDGWMHCLSHDGKLLWRQRSSEGMISMAAVGDIDRDGAPEIVYGTRDSHLIALDANGHLEWDALIEPLNMGRTLPVIADADRDGNAEVYTMCAAKSLHSGLVCVNGADGAVRWHGEMTHMAYCALAVVDLDGDGKDEILAGDKGTTLACFSPDGTLRWRTQMGGRGIWTRPAVADLDGDGTLEIVQTVRGSSPEGYGWYVLSPKGEILGSYKMEGGCFGSPLVMDLERDGVLDLIVTSRSVTKVHAYTFGGKAGEGAAVLSSWPNPPYPIRIGTAAPRGSKKSESMPLLGGKFRPNHFGLFPLPIALPEEPAERILETATRSPEGWTQLRAYRMTAEEGFSEAEVPVFSTGQYSLTLRLLDISERKVLGAQRVVFQVPNLLAGLKKAHSATAKELKEVEGKLRAEARDAAANLRLHRVGLEEDFAALAERIRGSKNLTLADKDILSRDVEKFFPKIDSTRKLAALIRGEVDAGRAPAFVMWRDENPWDNVDPGTELPEAGGPLETSLWAAGNEVEPVVISLVNLESKGMTVRVEPGTLRREGTGEKPRPAHGSIDFLRVVHLPSRFGPVVPDLLPPLGDGFLLDIPAGEVRQLWLNVRTHDLESGHYLAEWNLRTLDTASISNKLTLRIDVSPVRLPEESHFAMHFWAKTQLGEINTIPDLIAHRQNVWYQFPIPTMNANEQGELVGEIDWSAHDALLKQAMDLHLLLYGGPPTPKFPDGVEVTDALRIAGQRSCAKALVEHLRTFGLDYRNFAFYPQDEPGLAGPVDSYVVAAKAIKEIDPNYQVYANPIGMIDHEMTRQMEPYTDVWQPEIASIRTLGEEFIRIMRGPKGDKMIWMFTPPGNQRVLGPLDFFRGLAWLALYWGIEGGGYWVYHSDDLWGTSPTREPGFGAVAHDGRSLVTSRRWEATRDGSEDFDLVTLLREKLAAKPDAEAQRLLEDAIQFAGGLVYDKAPNKVLDSKENQSRFQANREAIGRALERLNKD
ncbi:MAG: VCBS repeat-containing protein [Candidatus Omnitrophica bacterium]|nr:VCBS repeat-containing protein [Candidatus Omnitrophota bacterium]